MSLTQQMIATDILVDLEESRVLLRVPGKYRLQVIFFNLPTFSHIPMRSYYYQVEAYIHLNVLSRVQNLGALYMRA